MLIGFFCFCLFLGNIFIFHFFNIKRRFFTIVKVHFLIMPIYLGLYMLSSEEGARKFIASRMSLKMFAFLNGIFLQFSFFYLCLYLIQVLSRSPSTKIMLEIEDSHNKRLTLDEIKQVYSLDRKIDDELEDMVFLGCLKNESGFYVLTKKGKIQMKLFKLIRDFLKLERS